MQHHSDHTSNSFLQYRDNTTLLGFLSDTAPICFKDDLELSMSAVEGLLSLPLFKQESLEAGRVRREHHLDADGTYSDSHDAVHITPSKAQMQALSNLIEQHRRLPELGFGYTLRAPTSPTCRKTEETLTYLNQGQTYEIKLKKFGAINASAPKKVKSIVRVLFHERHLQSQELEQFTSWQKARPGERMLCIDIPSSYGITDVKHGKGCLNSAAFCWEPWRESVVAVQLHCISTEFTARRHGGEKGVPFRLQVETFLVDDDGSRLIHCAYCQVKIFKPKGAERKMKTDCQKLERLSPAGRDKYQPAFDVTTFIEIPLQQLHEYHQVIKEQGLSLEDCIPQAQSPIGQSSSSDTDEADECQTGEIATPMPQVEQRAFQALSDSSSDSSFSRPSVMLDEKAGPICTTEPLPAKADSQQVADWLRANRFHNYVKVFQNFTGADILPLSKDDLIQICGLADGIRLYNALQARVLRPKLTVYVKPTNNPATGAVNGVSMAYGSVSNSPPPSPSNAQGQLQLGRNKRPLVEDDTETESCSSAKKSRRSNNQDVYHAVHLQMLTLNEFVHELCKLMCISARVIADVYLDMPSGITIVVNDNVVYNMKEQSRLTVEAKQAPNAPSQYKLHLKLLD